MNKATGMVLVRIGDALAAFSLVLVLVLTTRSGGEWLLILAMRGLSAELTIAVFFGAGFAVLAVLGWAVFRVTGAVSQVLALGLALSGLALVSLGYPALERHRKLQEVAPIFLSDFGPLETISAPRRIMLAEYVDGKLLGNGVQCLAACRALLTGGLVDEVVLAANFTADPAGMAARLDTGDRGCVEYSGCIQIRPADPSARPSLLIQRNHNTLTHGIALPDDARGFDIHGFRRTEIYLDGRPILRRTSAAVPVPPSFALPVISRGAPGQRLSVGFGAAPRWLSPQMHGANDSLASLLGAVTR